MPELPEVEAVVRTLRPLVVGRTIRRCRVIHPIVVRPLASHAPKRPEPIARIVVGRRIRAVQRRGKYLLVALDRGWLVLHFKFDGQLLWFDSGRLTGHVDIAFDMPHGTLGFVDPRHLSKIRFANSPDEIPGVRSLGIDPLSREFTVSFLARLLAENPKPAKPLLLDQSKIAGIGNIYSSEAMWRARLNPQRSANSLDSAEVRRIHKAIGDVLNRALECCLHPAPDFRDPNWWFHGLERILCVYGREAQKCRRCGHTIERIKQDGRSTFWCPHCQR